MNLRTKIILWFVVLHIVFAVAAAFIVMENKLLLFAVEACFVVSILVSYRLVRALFVPLEMIRTGTDLMNERDFGSKFVEVGQPELDRLIEIYNSMVDRLREERLAAEERHQLLQKLVEASPAGIVICDFDGKVQQMNPAASRLLQNADASSLAEGVMTIGGARRVKVWRREFSDRGFNKSFYLLEELTDELRLSEKAAYEKLIRMMSHEVNNSVGAVRSLLESLLRYAPQVSEQDRGDFSGALTVASKRVDSLNQFMGGLADVVRIPPPHLREASMPAMLDATITLVRNELDSRRITLESHVENDGAVRVDPHQFEQVLINVMRNAMESIGTDGGIVVTWRDHTLTVGDTGSGIDANAQQQLFTPFFTTKREGRGVGLTVIQEILTNHGATFWLENREGGGAEFGIRLA
jgi:nitrogen fixation/metabolism regulation signal transduction histidine kinase